MKIAKEMVDPEILAQFDIENFEENHRLSKDEWVKMLGIGYVAIYTARNEDNELAAVLALKTSSVNTGRWYFYSIAVSEKYRKMKLATRLFTEAIEAEISFGSINSHCHIDNVASIGFHTALGFAPIQYVNDFYGDYEDAIMWERRR
jgi:ribosomal protein S18 acetylase RimI-like enzyme